MDTVLGLSVTPTAVGWVLAEGHGADGTILDHQELVLRAGHGVRAVGTAEQVVDEVLRVDTEAAASDRRLRVIGVTWNDEASAQAALVLEALTDAGFDNVVPIRFLEAIETLARAIAPVIGYEQTAVCILDQDSTTVVMVDTHDGETQTATKHVRGGFDGLTRWLTGMFERKGWQPGGVVVVGGHSDIDGLSWQLETTLPVPVFVQSMAQVTIARGAALSAAASTEFTDDQLVEHISEPVPAPTQKRQLSYAGAMTALAAGAITFVGSVSLAVGIHVGPASAAGAPRATEGRGHRRRASSGLRVGRCARGRVNRRIAGVTGYVLEHPGQVGLSVTAVRLSFATGARLLLRNAGVRNRFAGREFRLWGRPA
ncbi:hypothetical protein, partial [Mycobacterium sp. 1245852.3]|uniref:DUF7159 family protein n=1 Tax=Mycobacterium sp. 1245852.3 TaxID=1856860 RepID=UPI003510DE76